MRKRRIIDTLKQLDSIPLPDKDKILSAGLQSVSPGYRPRPVLNDTAIGRQRLKPMVAVWTAVILLTTGLSTYAIAAEVQEYSNAVMFFREYRLSTEGLSRDEVKKVYRDIKTGTFTFSKTAEVIEKSISENEVGGYELLMDDPSPMDIENLWNYISRSGHDMQDYPANKSNVSYKYYSTEKYDEKLKFNVHDKSILQKYEDNELVWSAEFSNFYIENYTVAGQQVIVYGVTPTYSSAEKSNAWLALIDSNGSVLWQRKLNNGFKSEYIGAVVPTEEKLAVFSRGDLKYLCFSEYDLDGNFRSFHKTEVGNYGIWNAARLGDGYIVQLGSNVTGEYASIVKLDSNGAIVDSFAYQSDDSCYYITDMIEYNGSIYLSAYCVPVHEDEEKYGGGRYDIASILSYIFDNNLLDISNEDLTKMVREHFTAVLLVCDSASGVPREFYSVRGAVGGRLALNDSQNLVWNVESITDTQFSPATSAFTIGGVSCVYRYTFDEGGKILSWEKTDEVVRFIR